MMKFLTEDQALELIRAGKIGRLGCVDEDGAYVVPINYLLEGGAPDSVVFKIVVERVTGVLES